ncbi:MAG: esterase/lipase family protein, partial [Pannonibacter sp.]
MPALLMIHGIGCDGSAWDAMKPGFEAAGWTCEAMTLFPDRRLRENPPASLTQLGLADFIEAASAEAARLTARDGAKPAVIGHSMGGLIAQVLAERGDVSKAVFLTPAQTKDCAEIGLSVAWTFLNVILQQNRKKSYKVWKTGFSWGVLN